jgi:hypothetical protein
MLGTHRTPVAASVAALALLAALACRDATTGPAPAAPSASISATSAGPKLLKCSARAAAKLAKRLDTAGGDLVIDANRLVVPDGAVDAPTEFELAVPATNRAQVDLAADGREHFTFAEPVAITIDLRHCGDAELAGPLSVWYIDAQTGSLLEPMGGTLDSVAKTITFTTEHFSSYAVAH